MKFVKRQLNLGGHCSMSTIMGMLKQVIYSMYDSNGNLRVKFVGSLADIELSEGRVDLLKNITDLVLNTNIISEETKIYLKDRNIKVSQVNEIINERRKEKKEAIEKKLGNSINYDEYKEVSVNSTQSKITYDRQRLEKMLGSDILTNIIHQRAYNIEEYQIKVGKLLEKYKNITSLREELVLNLKEDCYNKEYNGDFKQDSIKLLKPYIKSEIKQVEKEINNNLDFVGYFNYLLSGVTCSTEKDKENRAFLRALLKGEEINTPEEAETKIEEGSLPEDGSEQENISDSTDNNNLNLDKEIDDILNNLDEDEELSSEQEEIEDNIANKEDIIDKFSLDFSSMETNKPEKEEIKEEVENSSEENKDNSEEKEKKESEIDSNTQDKIKTQRMQF